MHISIDVAIACKLTDGIRMGAMLVPRTQAAAYTWIVETFVPRTKVTARRAAIQAASRTWIGDTILELSAGGYFEGLFVAVMARTIYPSATAVESRHAIGGPWIVLNGSTVLSLDLASAHGRTSLLPLQVFDSIFGQDIEPVPVPVPVSDAEPCSSEESLERIGENLAELRRLGRA